MAAVAAIMKIYFASSPEPKAVDLDFGKKHWGD